MAFFERVEQIEAGVVDKVEFLDVYMQLGSSRDFIKRFGQAREGNKRSRPLKVQVDSVAVFFAFDIEVEPTSRQVVRSTKQSL